MVLPLLLALVIAAPAETSLRPLRLAAPAFAETIEIEVRDLPEAQAREAIQAALAEVAEVERLTDPAAPAEAPGAGLAALNARAGLGPHPIDPRLLSALRRALEVCFWSERAHGPLGRDLHRLWGLRSATPGSPATADPQVVQRALDAASCRNLRLDPAAGTAELTEGSAADLWGFAEGLAVDRAVEILRQRGVGNGFVQIGHVHRGIGRGSEGNGWRVQLPGLAGMKFPLGRIYLRDRSLAVASALGSRLFAAAGEPLPPYVSHRNGRPAQGTLATFVVSELALDAQALAVALMIAGPNEGQLRLGSLQPRPSVLWLQGGGGGGGEPLQIEYQWGFVPKR